MSSIRRLTVQELASTVSDTSPNSALAAKMWGKEIVDGSAPLRYFDQVVQQIDLPQGFKDYVVPYRTAWLSSWDVTSDEGGTQGEGYAVPYTLKNNLNGVTISPTPESVGIEISNHAARTNSVNLINDSQKDITEWYANYIDNSISTALTGATEAASGAKGRQVLYGDDATSTTTLATGDVLTTDKISKARRLLMADTFYYWDSGNWTKGSAKYPWRPVANEPFVLFVAPEQSEAMINNPQFTNASQWGTNEIILNGQILQYIGVKIIETTQVPSATNWGAGSDLAGHKCLMVKSGPCGAIVYGLRPRVHRFDYPSNLVQRITCELASAADSVLDDAIVEIDVLDE